MRSWLSAREGSGERVRVRSVPLLTLSYSIALLVKPLMLIIINDHCDYIDGWIDRDVCIDQKSLYIHRSLTSTGVEFRQQ